MTMQQSMKLRIRFICAHATLVLEDDAELKKLANDAYELVGCERLGEESTLCEIKQGKFWLVRSEYYPRDDES